VCFSIVQIIIDALIAPKWRRMTTPEAIEIDTAVVRASHDARNSADPSNILTSSIVMNDAEPRLSRDIDAVDASARSQKMVNRVVSTPAFEGLEVSDEIQHSGPPSTYLQSSLEEHLVLHGNGVQSAVLFVDSDNAAGSVQSSSHQPLAFHVERPAIDSMRIMLQ
jgi:hypothetical protein